MIALLVFAATYLVVAAGRVPGLRLDRTGAAVVGAIVMVVAGAISFDDAVRAVDFRTLVLLFGMMVVVAHLRLAGGLAALVRAAGAHAAHPASLLAAIVAVAGVLSALFVNDTICLVFTPIVLDIAAARGHRPLPYLLALATASNIGSTATVTGNPQNMLIGTASGLSFRAFAGALAPVAMAGLVIDAAIIWAIFHRELRGLPTDRPIVPRVVVHRALLAKTVAVVAAMLVAFLTGYDTALVAAGGAAALLVTRRVAPRKIYAAIDWDLLMLFAGLFVVVAGAERAGIGAHLLALAGVLRLQTVAGLTAAAAVLSNLVSNVPAVILFTRLVPLLPDPRRAWLTLAMSTTLAGNLTMLGSIANLIVVEGARRRGERVGFWEYARVGVPVTLATTMVGVWRLAAW